VPFAESDPIFTAISPYAASKLACEALGHVYHHVYGMDVVMLRFFTVYGPRQRPDLAIHAFARRMVEGEVITLFGDGSQARDYTYCDDIVAGVTAAIDWTATAPIGLEPFNLGGNRSVPTGAMVAELAQALGSEPKLQWGPMQPGDVHVTYADISASTRDLGFMPRTTIEEGIPRTVEWYKRYYGVE